MSKRLNVFISELFVGRNMLLQMVTQLLILRYRRTLLGYLWTLINPLLMMSVMAVIFSTLLKEDLKTFTVFLFAGMIPWNYFNAVVSQSGVALINNEALIKKIYLPKVIFPLSIGLALLIDGLLSFAALFFIILNFGGKYSLALIFLPVSYLLLFLFTLGVGLIISVATVFFRDLQYVIAIAMQGLFFLTPVLYKREVLTGKLAWLINLNPVTPFIELFRAPIVDAVFPEFFLFLQALMITCISITVGVLIFMRYEHRIVFRL